MGRQYWINVSAGVFLCSFLFFFNRDVAFSGSRKYSFLSFSAGTELAVRTLAVSGRMIFLNGLMEGRLSREIRTGWMMESSSGWVSEWWREWTTFSFE